MEAFASCKASARLENVERTNFLLCVVPSSCGWDWRNVAWNLCVINIIRSSRCRENRAELNALEFVCKANASREKCEQFYLLPHRRLIISPNDLGRGQGRDHDHGNASVGVGTIPRIGTVLRSGAAIATGTETETGNGNARAGANVPVTRIATVIEIEAGIGRGIEDVIGTAKTPIRLIETRLRMTGERGLGKGSARNLRRSVRRERSRQRRSSASGGSRCCQLWRLLETTMVS